MCTNGLQPHCMPERAWLRCALDKAGTSFQQPSLLLLFPSQALSDYTNIRGPIRVRMRAYCKVIGAHAAYHSRCPKQL